MEKLTVWPLNKVSERYLCNSGEISLRVWSSNDGNVSYADHSSRSNKGDDS